MHQHSIKLCGSVMEHLGNMNQAIADSSKSYRADLRNKRTLCNLQALCAKSNHDVFSEYTCICEEDVVQEMKM
jgi:hypothetical protein